MREIDDCLLLKLEEEEELQIIQGKLLELEALIKASVSEDVWSLLLKWEQLWSEYANFEMRFMYDAAMKANLPAFLKWGLEAIHELMK